MVLIHCKIIVSDTVRLYKLNREGRLIVCVCVCVCVCGVTVCVCVVCV